MSQTLCETLIVRMWICEEKEIEENVLGNASPVDVVWMRKLKWKGFVLQLVENAYA